MDRQSKACFARVVLCGLLFASLSPIAYGQGKKRSGVPTPEIYAGVIVKYKGTSSLRAAATSEASVRAMQERARVKLGAARFAALDAVVFSFAEPTPAPEARAAAARIALDPNVEYAVPDQMLREAQVTPNDPLYSTEQWNLKSSSTVVGGANLPLAWQRTTGSYSVVVAVVDGGIRPGHPDLAARVVPGYDFVSSDTFLAAGFPPNWVSADGGGRDSDATDPGNYIDAALLSLIPYGTGLTVRSSSWHGTHVAGTIGAASNNGLGVTGVDWSARLLPVRVLGRGGVGSTSDILDGIAWAAGLPVPGAPANPTPARIINVSIAGSGTCDSAMQAVISQVQLVGAVVIAATGNESTVVGKPANCSGVIAVTAHARDGDNADYANVGAQTTISAPGGGCNSLSTGCVDVTSTANTGTTVPLTEGYKAMRGTSMAAPHVSGVISLMLSLSPSLSATEIRSVLQSTARPHPLGSWCVTYGIGMCGSGLLDANAALVHVANNLPSVAASSSTALVRPLGTFTLTGTASALGGRQIAVGSMSWRQTSGSAVTVPSNANPVTIAAPNVGGQIGFLFTAMDTAGYSASSTVTLTVNTPPSMVTAGPFALTAGSAGSGAVTASDLDGDRITYVLTTGPSGLTMNAATGQWAWTPATSGTYTMTVMPSDSLGNGTAQTYTFNVAAATSAPPTGSASAPSGGGGALHWWIGLVLLSASAVRRRATLNA